MSELSYIVEHPAGVVELLGVPLGEGISQLTPEGQRPARLKKEAVKSTLNSVELY